MCLAKVTAGVQDFAWRKNRRALPGDERFPAHRPFIFAFENLKRLVLAMDMRWRAAARHVVRFAPLRYSFTSISRTIPRSWCVR